MICDMNMPLQHGANLFTSLTITALKGKSFARSWQSPRRDVKAGSSFSDSTVSNRYQKSMTGRRTEASWRHTSTAQTAMFDAESVTSRNSLAGKGQFIAISNERNTNPKTICKNHESEEKREITDGITISFCSRALSNRVRG